MKLFATPPGGLFLVHKLATLAQGISLATIGVLALALVTGARADDDWSRWRGPQGNGIAAADQRPPVQWDESTNVIWKARVPGRGHASPIVLKDRIFLATADVKAQSQSVLCYDRKTGKLNWQTEVNQGALNAELHPNNTNASSTIATDGERVFAVFNHHGGIYVTGMDLAGEILWQQRVGDYRPKYKFGFGASPIVYQGTVIVTNHNHGDAAMVAYDTRSGEQVWRHDSKVGTSFSTPVVATIGNQDQLLISGMQMIASHDPKTGKLIWQSPAIWEVTCATLVWDDQQVYASGGYPSPQTLAVKGDGSGAKVWQNNLKSYEQSMLLHDGYLYTHSDGGIIFCWRASDGKEMWKTRFSPDGRVGQSASPILADGKIYITGENSETVVFEASPAGFKEVARNKLGDEAFASLAVCGSQIFARMTMTPDGDRKRREEWLYCLGTE